MMTGELSHKIEISADVLEQDLGGETVLMDLKSGAYFGLDVTGTRIWQLIREKEDLPSALEALMAEFDVDEAQLRKDVRDLLADLSEAGLVSLGPIS